MDPDSDGLHQALLGRRARSLVAGFEAPWSRIGGTPVFRSSSPARPSSILRPGSHVERCLDFSIGPWVQGEV